MRHQFISEEQFKVIEQRVQASSGGVKEHTANSGRGRGAATERQQPNRTDGTMVKSSARTFQATNGYRSKIEMSWANYLQGLWMLKAITYYYYEPLNLRLPGKKNFYKPDFLVVSETGLTFYEVKGRNESDERSLVKMKTAAGIHLWAKFILVKRIRGNWEERHIQ